MRDETEKDKEKEPKLLGALLLGLIGATVTTFAVSSSYSISSICSVVQLRRTVEWFSVQSSWRGGSAGSYRTTFQEEARRSHNKRLQEEMERVRIRRMQNVFNRERNKYKRSYESWRENGPGAYHRHFQIEDWYWKADTSFRDQRTNYREALRESGNYALSHHYSVLGLDSYRNRGFRRMPYTDTEIKTAFRTREKEYHPYQNQNNIVASEAKFKEVMTSYEAIKQERRNQSL